MKGLGGDVAALRSEIIKSQQNLVSVSREKSTERLAEINSIKDNILNSAAEPFKLSENLTNWLKEGTSDGTSKNSNLKLNLEEAIAEPKINVIDDHVKEIVNPNVLNSFNPKDEEIKVLTKLKHSESDTNNLYRENLHIKLIREEVNFLIGKDIEQWKTIALEKSTALIGKSIKNNSIIMAIGSDDSYKLKKEFKFEDSSTNNKMCIETLSIWDDVLNKIRNIILIGLNGDLVWYELIEEEEDIKEIFRWRLMKTIDKMAYLRHDESDLLMLTILDEEQRAEVEFIEFNFQNSEFWVVQAFKLSTLPKSITFLGKTIMLNRIIQYYFVCIDLCRFCST